jgi:hypothetical protein
VRFATSTAAKRRAWADREGRTVFASRDVGSKDRRTK